MAELKVVHAADLHLDSPLRGLERYEGAPVEQIRSATRRAFKNLIDLCLEESAALLLLAGDLYDGDWRDYSTGLFFASELGRLREAGVKVVWIRGNHDAESRLTNRLPRLEGVYELPARSPGTQRFEELGIAVHGQSYARPDVTDDLSRGYPAPVTGFVNFGLLHTALEGRPGHATYCPCRLDALVSHGYDYWALGHVHAREVLAREPYVVYPGNLQGRQARESGDKGAYVITLESGRITDLTFARLDVVRWDTLSVDVSGLGNVDDVMDRVSDELGRATREARRLLALRVRLTGASDAHSALLESASTTRAKLQAVAAHHGDAWVERLEVATHAPVDVAALIQRGDALGQLARSLGELRSDAGARAELLRCLDDLREKLPAELRSEIGGLAGDEAAELALIDELEQLIVPELVSREDAHEA
jgi:DNA repair protein SbcD/Mre11